MIAQTQIDQARRADLLRLLEPDTTLVRIANTHGGEYAGPCPFCGGVDRFHVQPATGWWFCRQCHPRGGDAIDYVQRRKQLTFSEAVAFLVGRVASSTGPMRACQGTRSAPPPKPKPWTQPTWQRAAQDLVQKAEAALADRVGAGSRAYLTGRGLVPETWQTWRLGFHLAWQPVRREALPAITIPWFAADGALQAVQYRFFGPGISRHERFGQKAGGQRTLFGLPLLAGRETLIITEGELNAISCWQVAHDWADVVSIGSQDNARQGSVLETLKQAVMPYRQVIVWLDERERALTLVDQIAPDGVAIWSENGLDANDLLQRGLLAARLTT